MVAGPPPIIMATPNVSTTSAWVAPAFFCIVNMVGDARFASNGDGNSECDEFLVFSVKVARGG